MPTVYPLPGYPAVELTEDGQHVTIRPMVPQDKSALLAFFRSVPAEDRFYLKEDVTSKAVIDRWAEELDYGRVLPLLALKGDRIVADGTLHHRSARAQKHVGEVRVVVDPEFRNRGIGRWLLRKLAEIAKDQHLEKLVFEVVTGKEEPARVAARLVGFAPVAVLKDHVRDSDGTPHDLLIMEARVKDIEPDLPEVF